MRGTKHSNSRAISNAAKHVPEGLFHCLQPGPPPSQRHPPLLKNLLPCKGKGSHESGTCFSVMLDFLPFLLLVDCSAQAASHIISLAMHKAQGQDRLDKLVLTSSRSVLHVMRPAQTRHSVKRQTRWKQESGAGSSC